MSHLLQRIGGFIPPLVAVTLPVLSLPIASDSYILPRASLVLAAACLGTGVALLIPGRPPLESLRLPLLAAAAAALLAFVFSISWPLSLAGSYTRYESLPMRLAYLGLAASTVWLLRTTRQRELVGAGFVAGTTVVAFKAWLQWFNHAPFRPDGDLGNANLLAALIVMALPIAIDRGVRSRYLTGAWAVAIVVLLAGLIVTTSRSGALGLVAGCAVWLTLSVPARARIPVGAVSGAALVAALSFILFSPLRALNDDPPELRLNLWQDALRMIAARPVTGWGQDTTGLAFGHFLSRDYAGLVTFDRVHSGLLEIAATQGVIGFGALGWVVLVVAFAAWRGRMAPGVAGIAGALAAYTVWVFFNFDWAPATGAFWLLAGTLWSTAASAPSPPAPVAPRPSPRWAGIASVVLALAAAWLAVFPVLADAWYVHGRPDLAVKVDPLQAQYHWAIGTVDELHQAAGLGETEPKMYVQLGDLEARRGDPSAARAAYQRALEIDPFYSPAAQRLAALGYAPARERLRTLG